MKKNQKRKASNEARHNDIEQKDEDVGAIPVVADQKTKRLLGIITDRDLAVKVVASARHIPSVKIEEVMSRNHPLRLKNWMARSCFCAAALVSKVPRFLRLPVFASTLRE